MTNPSSHEDKPPKRRLRPAVVVPVLLVCAAVIFLATRNRKSASEESQLTASSPAGAETDSSPDRSPAPELAKIHSATNNRSKISPQSPLVSTTSPEPYEASLPPTSGDGSSQTNRPATAGALAGSAGGESGPAITGRITLMGASPPETPLPFDANCGSLNHSVTTTQFYRTGRDGGLADVVVYLSPSGRAASFPSPQSQALLDQAGCVYSPYISAIRTGQPLLVRNSDPLMHNVHVLPTANGNKESNRAQMAGAPELRYIFEQPEMFLRFKCDVHPWMFAYVSIFDHPFYSVTDTNGFYRIEGVSAGEHTLVAQHRKLGALTKQIQFTNDLSGMDFVFQIAADGQ